MNEEPKNVWKRPLKRKWLAFLAVVAVVALIIVCFGLVSARPQPLGDLVPTALLMALSFSILVLLVVGFIRWLCCWRNFRRFLFGVACLVTLVALFYAEENWRGKRAWERHRAEWVAKGEKFTIAELLPPPVPDEKNFALTPLLKPALEFTQSISGVVWVDTNALARLQRTRPDLSPGRSTNDQLVLGSLDKGTFADLAACREFYLGNTNYPQPATAGTAAEVILFALSKFDAELKELHEATESRPLTRFPIRYEFEPPWGILLPHLAHLRGLTQLTHVRATAELEAGRSAEALADLKTGFRISDGIRDEPILIDHLVRIACLNINLQTLREGLKRHAWSDEQLVELENYLASLNLLAEYKLAMRGERTFSAGGLDFLRRQGFKSNPFNYLGVEGGAASSPGFNVMPSGWFYQNMLTISRMHQDFTFHCVDEATHRVFPEICGRLEEATQVLGAKRLRPYKVFAALLFPALNKATMRSAQAQTYVDAARVACALERYRLANERLPDALEGLTPRWIRGIPTDVIDGKPLRYRPQADGSYVLYSLGWNQTDDRGELAWKRGNTPRVDAEKGDWVWQYPAK